MNHFNSTIIGWFTFPHLYKDMAESLPDNATVVEVGVYEGKSFAYLMVEMINAGKQLNIFAVDSFTFTGENGKSILDNFIENMKPVEGQYKIIKSQSWDAASNFKDRSIDFVFIDADHIYESVKRDILAWLPKIKQGGIIAGHDYCNEHPGVIQAVDEIFGKKLNRDYIDELCWVITIC